MSIKTYIDDLILFILDNSEPALRVLLVDNLICHSKGEVIVADLAVAFFVSQQNVFASAVLARCRYIVANDYRGRDKNPVDISDLAPVVQEFNALPCNFFELIWELRRVNEKRAAFRCLQTASTTNDHDSFGSGDFRDLQNLVNRDIEEESRGQHVDTLELLAHILDILCITGIRSHTRQLRNLC